MTMTTAACIVCLGDAGVVQCSDYNCRSLVCKDCIGFYIDVCGRDKKPPRCVAPMCEGLYLRSSCEDFAQAYDMALFHGLLNDPEIEERKKHIDARRSVLREIVQSRRKFLVEQFPASIRRAVEIMYAAELSKVQRAHQRSLAKNAAQLTTRRCFHTFCGGYITLLDASDKWRCGKCDTTFCALCEDVTSDAHTCRPEEYSSVQWKRALPSCPRCGQFIEKNGGCRFMTCSVCNQNFDYTTGEKSAAGNHGQSTPVSVDRHEDGFARLCEMLLKGRTTAELTEREQELFRRIQGVAREYGAIDNVSSSWSVVQVLPKQMGTHTERTAKTLALKVEALEIKRQTYRRLTNCLRELEREIRLPQHEIDIDIDLTIA